jgi:hypothetical protein
LETGDLAVESFFVIDLEFDFSCLYIREVDDLVASRHQKVSDDLIISIVDLANNNATLVANEPPINILLNVL